MEDNERYINTIPRISVIVPLYNKVREVQRSLISIFNQTVQEYELLIIDGGSTDGSLFTRNPKVSLQREMKQYNRQRENSSPFLTQMMSGIQTFLKQLSAFTKNILEQEFMQLPMRDVQLVIANPVQ